MELEIINFLTALIVTGLFSGFIAGLLGVGGGIIIVPVIYYILRYQNYSLDIVMHVAIASSICIIFFTSISSIYSHYKLNNLDLNVLKKWFLGVILGSVIGALIASSINGNILVILFIIIASIVAINMVFDKEFLLSKKLPKNYFLNNTISFFIGSFSTLIGIGGGSFSVPTLMALGKNIHIAVGTSASIGFLISLPGLITYSYTGWFVENLPNYSIGYINIPIVISIASTSIIMAPIGAKLSSKFNKKTLKKIFALFLLLTCISLAINLLY